MNAKEQEALFAKLRKDHPGWTPRFCSGYVHGVIAEEEHKNPQQVQVDAAHDLDHYALGYLTAFAIHRGPDVETETWFDYVGLLVESVREGT